MPEDLERVGRTWERLGRSDPFWAVLSDSDKKGNRWAPDEFFATGARLVDELFDRLAQVDAVPAGGAALDFGCGVGRISQALGARFESVTGVDIALSMIEAAERFNRHPGKVRYLVNTRPDLGLFADAAFDFAVTFVTLQHMPPHAALHYVEELLRVLRRGGVAVIQAPARPARTPAGLVTGLIPSSIRAMIRGMEMHAVPGPQIEAAISASGARLIDVHRDSAAGPRWFSLTYIIRK